MSKPTNIGSFAEAVYAELEPFTFAEESATVDYALLKYVGAIGEILQLFDTCAYCAPNPAWSLLLDSSNVPAAFLPWLGQFVGTIVDTALSESGQRSQILARAGWARGTPAQMANSIKKFLTGTKTVKLYERDTSPYHVSVVTLTSETPADHSQVLATLLTNKPAGLVLDYQVLAVAPVDWTYGEIYDNDPNYQDIYSTEESYEDIYYS